MIIAYGALGALDLGATWDEPRNTNKYGKHGIGIEVWKIHLAILEILHSLTKGYTRQTCLNKWSIWISNYF